MRRPAGSRPDQVVPAAPPSFSRRIRPDTAAARASTTSRPTRGWSGCVGPGLLRATVRLPRTPPPEKAAASAPGVPLRPEGQGMEPGGPAQRRPGAAVAGRPPRALEGKVEEQLAVGGEVAPLLVDPPAEPGPGLELIGVGVPEN